MVDTLENVKFDKADATDSVEQTEETLLTEIKKQVTDIQLETIDTMTKDQLATFIEKEFKNADGSKWLTYSSMVEKGQFYAFALEAAMDFISDIFGDKKYTAEGIEDTTDGTGGGKTLDEWLKDYGSIDAISDTNNTKIATLLQNILGITADGFAGPETMANLVAILKSSTLESIQVDGYDENNPYTYQTISKLVSKEENGVTKEVPIVYAMQDKIVAYTAATTVEAKAIIVTEVETYLAKTYTNYTGAGFHKNLATAILTNKESFTWNNIIYYPIVAIDGTVVIADSNAEAITKKEEAKKAKEKTDRKIKAKTYADKIFPESLTIAQAGDIFYIELPTPKPPLVVNTPAITGQIPFSSKENAQSFIDMSKKFIQDYGYAVNKNRTFSMAKNYYIANVKNLMAAENANVGVFSKIFKNIEIETKISLAIDNLECWDVTPASVDTGTIAYSDYTFPITNITK